MPAICTSRERRNTNTICSHYGHPSKFGYKDLGALWKAENFDPEGLMEKYYKAGAR